MADASVRARAVAWVLLSAAAFALMAVSVRQATHEVHPFHLVFLRSLFGVLLMVPWIAHRGVARLRTRQWRPYAARAVFELLTMACLFLALSRLALAEAVTLSFTLPLFGTIGAAVVLREVVRAPRWVAVGVGFAGVLVLVRPGFETVSPYAAVALLAAASAAASALVVKRLARTEPADVIVFYMGVMVTPLSLLPAVFLWRTPSMTALGWIVAVTALGTLAHLAVTRSLALADASFVMPWKYVQLVGAAVLGYICYGETLDAWGFVGAALIVTAAVWVTLREARDARAPAAAALTASQPSPTHVGAPTFR